MNDRKSLSVNELGRLRPVPVFHAGGGSAGKRVSLRGGDTERSNGTSVAPWTGEEGDATTMPTSRSTLRFCGLALVLGAIASVPLGSSAASDSWRAIAADEERDRVDIEMLHGLVFEHCRLADASWRNRLVEAIHQESKSAGVDPLLVGAIVARESSFRTLVVSRSGAVGLMQLRPFVARDLARRTELEWREGETLRRPESNVRLGVTYYRELMQRFGGDASLALAAYHRGPTRVARELRQGVFAGSGYARRVLGLYGELDARRNRRLARRG